MIIDVKMMCTGKPEPRAWEFNGRSGVSYKVDLSDGSDNLEFPVLNSEIWNVFEPFKQFTVRLQISQVAQDNRLSTRIRVIGAQKA